MKAALLPVCLGLLLASCSTHSDQDIAAVRSAGVAPRTVAKLERDRVLLPEDLVELRRHRVPDAITVRHLREVGVDYLPQRNDLQRLRSGGVQPVVVDELIFASRRFLRERDDGSRRFAFGVGMPYDPWYGHFGYSPYAYDYSWPYY
jgi:hypothetical protein